LTGKRGALLIYAFLLCYSLINIRVLAELIAVNYKTLFFALITVIIAIFAIDNALESLKYRFTNIVDERTGEIGSGRSYLWTTLITYWWEGNVSKIFIGSGFDSPASYFGYMAHNDFVSFLFEYGLLGISIYLIMLSKFRKAVKQVVNDAPYLGYLLMMCLIILIGRGFITGTMRTDNLNLTLTIGYLLAITVIKRKNYIKNKFNDKSMYC
jgi:O-antigen ligase